MSASEGSWSSVPSGKIVPHSFIIAATGRAPGGYTVYKVSFEIKVQLPHGETVFNTFEVWKRFNDFQQLSKQLEVLHTQARVPDKFPRLVKASYFERFKEAVIEERKMSAVAMLKFASTQDHLTQSLVQFTEGAVKVKSMPFQQTPVQPTTTYIEKPKDKVPLSRLLQDPLYHVSGSQDQAAPHTDTEHLTVRSREQSCSPTGSSESLTPKTRDLSTSPCDLGDTGNHGDELTEKTFNEFYIASPESSGDEESHDVTISSGGGGPLGEGGGPLGEGGGLSWWTDAMNVTDDLDTLVDRVNENSVSTLSVAREAADEPRKSQSRSPSPGRRPPPAKVGGADYIAQAGKLITAALKCESQKDYQEAFDLFKAGVDLLLNGVQTDSSKRRREIVSRKTAEYLHHAEMLHQKHLSSASPQPEVDPPAPTVKPHHLPDFRVVAVIDKVLVVESRHTGQRFVVKVLYKSLQLSSRGRGVATNRALTHCQHMVKLLHHYQTSNHRIFLLLEYVQRGRLVDFVMDKRNQWGRLHEAILNPPTTSSLIKRPPDSRPPAAGSDSPGGHGPQPPTGNEEEMERMLSELTHIVPPTSLPVTDSITSDQSVESNAESGVGVGEVGGCEEDSLSVLRRRLQEVSVAEEESEGSGGVSVCVQPPTPTVPTGPVTVTTSTSNLHSGTSTPRYSPGSRGSPEPSSKVDDWGRRLEESVREWAAQIILALEHLHTHGIVCRDLNPANILLTDSGKAVLTYFGKWDYVEQRSKFELIGQLYVAPELRGLSEGSEACDWWSLGALLFEILTGKTLLSCHPGGLHSHLPLRLPTPLSPEAQSLLTQLLQVDPRERLGSGSAGAEELKSHPFFNGIDWKTV